MISIYQYLADKQEFAAVVDTEAAVLVALAAVDTSAVLATLNILCSVVLFNWSGLSFKHRRNKIVSVARIGTPALFLTETAYAGLNNQYFREHTKTISSLVPKSFTICRILRYSRWILLNSILLSHHLWLLLCNSHLIRRLNIFLMANNKYMCVRQRDSLIRVRCSYLP